MQGIDTSTNADHKTWSKNTDKHDKADKLWPINHINTMIKLVN